MLSFFFEEHHHEVYVFFFLSLVRSGCGSSPAGLLPAATEGVSIYAFMAA